MFHRLRLAVPCLLVGCILASLVFAMTVGKRVQPTVSMDFVLRNNNPPAFHVANLSRLYAGDCGQPLIRYGRDSHTLVFLQFDVGGPLTLNYEFFPLENGLTVKVYWNGDEVGRHERLTAQTLSGTPVANTLTLPGRKGGNILLFLYRRGGSTTPTEDRLAFSRLVLASKR